MSRFERLITWSTMMLLVGSCIAMFVHSSNNAMAWNMEKAPELGPASQLTLQAEDGSMSDLKMVDGRLSWGVEPQQSTQSVAYVHIGALLPLLMSQEERVEERAALRERLTEDAQVLIDQLDTIKSNMEDLTPGEEEHQAQLQMGQAIAQQLQSFQQEAIAEEDAKTSEQLEKCYRELVAAVNVVADRQKIDTVFRFIPTDDEFSTGDSNSAMLQIRLRTFLRYPDRDDITEDIAEELNLTLE
ncbi:MAG: OmpH family outer membrane protein [Phycisphaerales bacterium]|nr:OmpH family outer membrane protein [Phycisphaerales bacterium]|tara:strand:- start:2503 stop:3231 length:729 start_codon:yes stop_codon:yes gene_type:complete